MPPKYHPLGVLPSLKYNPRLRGGDSILPSVIVIVVLVIWHYPPPNNVVDVSRPCCLYIQVVEFAQHQPSRAKAVQVLLQYGQHGPKLTFAGGGAATAMHPSCKQLPCPVAWRKRRTRCLRMLRRAGTRRCMRSSIERGHCNPSLPIAHCCHHPPPPIPGC